MISQGNNILMDRNFRSITQDKVVLFQYSWNCQLKIALVLNCADPSYEITRQFVPRYVPMTKIITFRSSFDFS